MRLRKVCGDGFGEYLGVGATEVVGVDGCGVVECALLDAGEGEGQGVGGGWFGDELRGERGDGLSDGGLADDELRLFPAEFGEELVAGEQGFAEAEAVGVEAGVELSAAGVEDGADGCGRRLIWIGEVREAGEDGEARDGDQRKVEGVAEALGGAEADAHSGKRAGAVDDGYGVELAKVESAAGHERVDGRDEALGSGAAGEGRYGGRAGGVGEGQAAGCATGVDEQKIQFGRGLLDGMGSARRKRRFSRVKRMKSPKVFKNNHLSLDFGLDWSGLVC